MFSRLTLKLYVALVALLLILVATMFMVGWMMFKREPSRDWVAPVKYAVTDLAPFVEEQDALPRELIRVQDELDVTIELFDGEGKLLLDERVSSDGKGPPLILREHERRKLFARGEWLGHRPPRLAVLLDRSNPELGYAVVMRKMSLPVPSPVLWGLVVALLAGAVTSVLFTRSLVRPLRRLEKAAKCFGGGDLDARVEVQRRDDFGQLAATFNEMAQRIALLVRAQQELLANVSHELRTPLARVRVAIDFAAEGDAQLAGEVLPSIAGDLQELETLVDDVLRMARLDLAAGRLRSPLPMDREKVPVFEVVEGAAERFNLSHGAGRLEFSPPPESCPLVRGDAVLLRRAVDNLLDNAHKYSEQHLPVKMSVEVLDEAVEIVIIDQGVGISTEDLEQVGTPFFRADRSRTRATGGVGLGLSLVRRIAEAHGGSVGLSSEPDQGTVARLRLPLEPCGESGRA